MTTLDDIIQLVKWGMGRTRDAVPYSGNLPDPVASRQLSHRVLYQALSRYRASTPQEKKFVQELWDWHLDLSSDKERYPLNDSELWIDSLQKFIPFRKIHLTVEKLAERNLKKRADPFELIEAFAVSALKWGTGNCHELAAYLMLLLLEYPSAGLPGLPKIDKPISIELVGYQTRKKRPNQPVTPGVHYTDIDYDHAFVILNRDPKKPLNDVMAWNDDAVICDPWTQEVYTKKQLFEDKDDEEKKFIIDQLRALKPTILMQNIKMPLYVSNQYNAKVHSKHWYEQHKKHGDKKFWRSKQLLDVKKRPVFKEKFPPFRPLRYGSVNQPWFLNAAKKTKPLKKIPITFKMNDFLDIYQETMDITQLSKTFAKITSLLNKEKFTSKEEILDYSKRHPQDDAAQLLADFMEKTYQKKIKKP